MTNDDHIINFDHVSITFDIPLTIQEETIQKLIDLAQNKTSKNQLKIECRYTPEKRNKSRYRKAFTLKAKPITKNVLSAKSDVNGFKFKLELDPIDRNQEKTGNRKKQNFAKLSFNPNKTGIKGTQRIFLFLSSLIGLKYAKAIYRTGRMTRVDMCADLYQPLPFKFPYLLKVHHYEIIPPHPEETQSMIIGDGRSRDRIIIYDKAAEQQTRKGNSTQKIHFRLELRRRDLRCTPKEFEPEPLRKKLSSIEFFSCSLLKDEELLPDFKNSVNSKGVIGALVELSKKERRKHLKRLRRFHAMKSPFDIDEINIHSFHEILRIFNNR